METGRETPNKLVEDQQEEEYRGWSNDDALGEVLTHPIWTRRN